MELTLGVVKLLITNIECSPLVTEVQTHSSQRGRRALSLHFWPGYQADNSSVICSLWPTIVSHPPHIVVLAFADMDMLKALVMRHRFLFQEDLGGTQLIFACNPPIEPRFAKLTGDVPSLQSPDEASGPDADASPDLEAWFKKNRAKYFEVGMSTMQPTGA